MLCIINVKLHFLVIVLKQSFVKSCRLSVILNRIKFRTEIFLWVANMKLWGHQDTFSPFLIVFNSFTNKKKGWEYIWEHLVSLIVMPLITKCMGIDRKKEGERVFLLIVPNIFLPNHISLTVFLYVTIQFTRLVLLDHPLIACVYFITLGLSIAEIFCTVLWLGLFFSQVII